MTGSEHNQPEKTEPSVPAERTEPVEPPEPLPAVALLEPSDGVPEVVRTAAQLRETVRALAAGTGPVAVDTERASGYRYWQRAYLIQLRRTGSGTALIDPIEIADFSPLAAVLDGPEWILHAATQDLPCLAELGLRPARLFDTELAGRLAGFPRVALATMTRELLGYDLEKGHSAADWSKRPLPREWLTYAALDVELLVQLREAVAQLLASQAKLDWAEQEFEAIRQAPPAPPRTDPWRRTSGIHRIRQRRGLARVQQLWLTRDAVAARRDIAPGRVLPDATIMAAAKANPTSQAELAAMREFSGKSLRRSVGTWWQALQHAAALPEQQLPPLSVRSPGPPPANRWKDSAPEAAARLAASRAALAALADQVQVPAENLLAPAALRELAWQPPDPVTQVNVAAALEAAGAREWQRRLCTGPVTMALTTAQQEAAAAAKDGTGTTGT